MHGGRSAQQSAYYLHALAKWAVEFSIMSSWMTHPPKAYVADNGAIAKVRLVSLGLTALLVQLYVCNTKYSTAMTILGLLLFGSIRLSP